MIFYLGKSTTPYVVVVWGDRCGREVPHFDSRPISISDSREGMSPQGLFGPPPFCRGPTDRPAAELTLLFGGGYQDDFFMPIKEPRDANPRKTIREMRKN